jgi:hypothetical protein
MYGTNIYLMSMAASIARPVEKRMKTIGNSALVPEIKSCGTIASFRCARSREGSAAA